MYQYKIITIKISIKSLKANNINKITYIKERSIEYPKSNKYSFTIFSIG